MAGLADKLNEDAKKKELDKLNNRTQTATQTYAIEKINKQPTTNSIYLYAGLGMVVVLAIFFTYKKK